MKENTLANWLKKEHEVITLPLMYYFSDRKEINSDFDKGGANYGIESEFLNSKATVSFQFHKNISLLI